MKVFYSFFFLSFIIIGMVPCSGNSEDPDNLLVSEIIDSGKKYFAEAEKETNAQYPNPGILIGCAHEEAALKASGNSVKNKAFFNYFRAPGVWEQIFEAFKPVIKKYPQSKRHRVQLFKYAVYADRVNELWSWLRKEQL